MAPRNRTDNHNAGVRQVLQGSKEQVQEELIEEALRQAPGGLNRIVDMRIPLWQLIALAGSFAGFQIMLWQSQREMTSALVKVEAKLETSSAQTVQTLIEVSRIKDRVDRVSDDYRTIQQQVTQLQQQRAQR